MWRYGHVWDKGGGNEYGVKLVVRMGCGVVCARTI